MKEQPSRNAPISRYGTHLRIYDNGGRTLDRYTILPPRNATDYRGHGVAAWGAPWGWSCIVSSADMHVSGYETATPGSHLGKRITWDALPAKVQAFARTAFPEFCYDVDRIVDHFCIAAVWADCQEDTSPRMTNVGRKAARDFVVQFLREESVYSSEALSREDYGWHDGKRDACAQFGHDLYLTSAGHGAGFFDREALKPNGLGDLLTQALRDAHVEAEQYGGWMTVHASLHRDLVVAA